jgi:hypothetical protein
VQNTGVQLPTKFELIMNLKIRAERTVSELHAIVQEFNGEAYGGVLWEQPRPWPLALYICKRSATDSVAILFFHVFERFTNWTGRTPSAVSGSRAKKAKKRQMEEGCRSP